MAAKGSISKEIIVQKILDTFEGAFKFDKEIRIPMIEDGAEVQIKVTLTCAKTNVESGMDTAIPGAITTTTATPTPKAIDNHGIAEVTEEEKQNVLKAMAPLGL